MILFFFPLLVVYLLVGLLLCVAVGWLIARKSGSKVLAVSGFAVVFLVMFGWEIYGYLYWRKSCWSDAGLHVYKAVPPVEGFYYGKDSGLNEEVAEYYLSKGYRYVEGQALEGYLRYEYHGSEISKVPVNELVSQYAFVKRAYDLRGYIWVVEYAVVERSSGEVIGALRNIGYKGAVVVRFFRRITGADYEGSASYCGMDKPLYELLTKSLPVNI